MNFSEINFVPSTETSSLGSLDEEVVNLNMNIDKFGKRWRQLKPTGEVKSWENSEVMKVFEALDDWKKQFEELQNHATALTESCLTFGVPKPKFDGLDVLIDDLKVSHKHIRSALHFHSYCYHLSLEYYKVVGHSARISS
jgi:hypothetical protein